VRCPGDGVEPVLIRDGAKVDETGGRIGLGIDDDELTPVGEILLVHAGVAGALKDHFRIDREDERLIPCSADLPQVRLGNLGRGDIAEERREENV
jgi:hypothetical protein